MHIIVWCCSAEFAFHDILYLLMMSSEEADVIISGISNAPNPSIVFKVFSKLGRSLLIKTNI